MKQTNTFFFITSYDDISSELIAFLLNSHPDLSCSTGKSDLLMEPSHHQTVTLDEWIVSHTYPGKIYNGNINQFSAYELQNRILLEKSTHPIRRVHLTISPYLRVKLLMHSWLLAFQTPENAVQKLDTQFATLQSTHHEIIHRYQFRTLFNTIKADIEKLHIDLALPENKLFLFALTKLITQDSADLPSSSRKYLLENLLANELYLVDFMNELTSSGLSLPSIWRLNLKPKMDECRHFLERIQHETSPSWMHDLITKYIELRLPTIYHPHVDKPLIHFYKDCGYTFPASANAAVYSKLISIQLNSNRPAQLSLYFDNIEETADDTSQIEVLVNIDTDDVAMHDMLEREIPRRSFTIKYIATPRPASFCDLWKPINQLLTITDPHAYFLLNISDEMLFATRGWDSLLKKYVGFFPDHLFRLRASRNKIRNYFDRWECSFGQDAIPITTKKWVDTGGDWNPCFGPDSFQQLISLYLAKEGQFSNHHYLRELPIIDIAFHGDIPALGIHPAKAWRHNRDHILAMQICQSHAMQQEARRRAILIKAHIMADRLQLAHFDVVDDKMRKQIHLIDTETTEVVAREDYRLSWLGITLTNQFRKLRFYAYFGSGMDYHHGYVGGFLAYLKSKYHFFAALHHCTQQLCSLPKRLVRLTVHVPLTIVRRAFNLLRKIRRRIIRVMQ